MILDRFENLMKYEALIPNLANALEFCKKAGDLAPGRYEFEGGFMLIQEGETAATPEEGNFEAHKEYIDVQVLVEGAEVMAWADLAGLELARALQAGRLVLQRQGHRSGGDPAGHRLCDVPPRRPQGLLPPENPHPLPQVRHQVPCAEVSGAEAPK